MGFDLGSAFGGMALGGLGGGLMGGGDPAKKQYQQILKLYQQLMAQQKADLGIGLTYQNKGLGELSKGYDSAIKSANMGFGAAKQGVMDNQSKALGSLQGQMAKSGLGNTTVSANLQGQVYGQGSKALAGIDEQLAQIMAGLHQQKGHAMAGGYGGLAQYMQSASGQKTQLGQGLAGMMGSVQHGPSPFESIMGAAGNVLPWFLMGGG
jgi:hypothetical protein